MNHTQPEQVEIVCTIKFETDVGILVFCHELGEDKQFPMSQVHSIRHEHATKGADRIFVTPWIAKKKGIL